MRLKIDGVLFNDDGKIYEFDNFEVEREDIKCYKNNIVLVHFQGVNFSKFLIVNDDGTETSLIKEDNKDSNLELLNNEMVQASMKFELQDLHETNNIIEEKASLTLEDINNKLIDLNNKDKQYNEDINSIKELLKTTLEQNDNKFRELQKYILDFNSYIYTINNRLKSLEEAK